MPELRLREEDAMPDVVFRRILVPTDFSPQSERAWDVARKLARAVGAEIELLHVFVPSPPPYVDAPFPAVEVTDLYASTRQWVEDQLGQWAAKARGEGLAVKTDLRDGVAYKEIVAAARDVGADLIAIGTHGYSGVERLLLGSVADKVVRLAHCPVLAVRQPDPE
jgi:nucleotide-binding universal stress UspA family protein